MEFSDEPKFAIAGVTDWTAVGGHGSDSTLRTSEQLAREALALKQTVPAVTVPTGAENKLRTALAAAPGSFTANHQLGALYLATGRFAESVPLLLAAYQIDPANQENEYDLAQAYERSGDLVRARDHANRLRARQETARLHHLLAEIDEKAGDALSAVREDEQAVRLDPSEENYFAWGSELLLHRAVWQAAEVFLEGSKAHPASARMLVGLGTAQFSGALYQEASTSLCAASDLNPADPEPYLFLGRIQMAAPSPLSCIESHLARFLAQQPANPLASYYSAVALLKREPDAQARAQELLRKAVTLDPRCAPAFLELGILAFSQRQPQAAIENYLQAIQADPHLAEAHYRLAMAYDRMGMADKAKAELALHDQLEKEQAAAVEQQRRDVKQFVVVNGPR
jgi:tetratricopeptide (TPR) repeat protein